MVAKKATAVGGWSLMFLLHFEVQVQGEMETSLLYAIPEKKH